MTPEVIVDSYLEAIRIAFSLGDARAAYIYTRLSAQVAR